MNENILRSRAAAVAARAALIAELTECLCRITAQLGDAEVLRLINNVVESRVRRRNPAGAFGGADRSQPLRR